MSQRFSVATRKGLFTIERQTGSRWAITAGSFLGDNLSYVQPDSRDGSIYAALDHGHFGAKLHRSPDGGKSWEESTAPTYPPKPESEVDQDMWGKPIPWKLVRIWALAPGHPSEPGVLWCGTIPGGLFR